MTTSPPPFDPTLITMIRRVMPNLIASELLGVQPMTANVGNVFTMRQFFKRVRDLYERMMCRIFHTHHHVRQQTSAISSRMETRRSGCNNCGHHWTVKRLRKDWYFI